MPGIAYDPEKVNEAQLNENYQAFLAMEPSLGEHFLKYAAVYEGRLLALARNRDTLIQHLYETHRVNPFEKGIYVDQVLIVEQQINGNIL